MRMVFTSDAGDYLMEIMIPDREGDRILVERDRELLEPVLKPDPEPDPEPESAPVSPSEAITETFNAFGVAPTVNTERGQSTYAWEPMATTLGMAHLVPCPGSLVCLELHGHIHTADGAVHPRPVAAG